MSIENITKVLEKKQFTLNRARQKSQKQVKLIFKWEMLHFVHSILNIP